MNSYSPFVWPPTNDSQQMEGRYQSILRKRGTNRLPAPPRDVKITAGPMKIIVDWKAPEPSAASKESIVGFNIYADTENNRVQSINDPACTHAEVVSSSGTARNIFVTSVGQISESRPVGGQGSAGVMSSSELLPSNAVANSRDTATIDSIDAGTSATIRVYEGAPGSPYRRIRGANTYSRPAGSLVGFAYNTKYYIVWNGKAHQAFSSKSNTYADGLEYLDEVTTCGSGGGGGSTGGGGSSGGGGATPPADVANFHRVKTGITYTLYWNANSPAPDHYELRISLDEADNGWEAAQYLDSVTALTYPGVSGGLWYYIKAWADAQSTNGSINAKSVYLL